VAVRGPRPAIHTEAGAAPLVKFRARLLEQLGLAHQVGGGQGQRLGGDHGALSPNGDPAAATACQLWADVPGG
jgi:hypothetical protein